MGVPRSAWTLLGALALGPACDWSPPPVDDSPARRAVRIPQPIEPPEEGVSVDLLQAYAKRDPIPREESELWELPFQSKRLVVALLILAGKDRLEDLDMVLTPDATWGLPETRRLGARPIFGPDGGEAFLAAFRSAARRFDEKAVWKTTPLPTGPQEAVRAGAEPLWSYYVNGDDRIYFREVLYRGAARIDYVGFFEEVPTAPIQVVDHGHRPPMGPPVRRAPRAEAIDGAGDPDGAGDLDGDAPRIPVPTPDPV
jgi:hypothetical protein